MSACQQIVHLCIICYFVYFRVGESVDDSLQKRVQQGREFDGGDRSHENGSFLPDQGIQSDSDKASPQNGSLPVHHDNKEPLGNGIHSVAFNGNTQNVKIESTGSWLYLRVFVLFVSFLNCLASKSLVHI